MHISIILTSLVLVALFGTAECGPIDRAKQLGQSLHQMIWGKSKVPAESGHGHSTVNNGGEGPNKRGDGDETAKLRMNLPTDKIQWKEYGGVEWKEYTPVNYTKPKEWKLFDKKKADDPVETDFHKKVNGKNLYDFHQKQQLTYKGYEGLWIDRSGYNYEYKLDSKGRPLYPEGRRGLDGLGGPWWGPVHAADIAITVKNGNDMEVIVIERTLNEGWALPGGKVDPVEKKEMLDNRHPGGLSDAVLIALKKEFVEEVLGYGTSDENVPKVAKRVQELQECLWSKVTPVVVYSGPVKKDRRNRDHSWFDTKVVVFHIEHMTKNEIEEKCFKLGEGGTDHGVVENGVHWMKFSELKGKTFFASHREYVGLVAQHHHVAF